MKCPKRGRQPRHHTTPAFTRERARRANSCAPALDEKEEPCGPRWRVLLCAKGGSGRSRGRGSAAGVAQTSSAFQGAKQDRFIRAVEELSGRRVIAFMSDTNVGPDVEIELFVLARPGEADAG